MEIGLLHAAFLQGDFLHDGGAEPKHDARLDLAFHNVRVDHLPQVGSHSDPVHFNRPVFHADLGDLGHVGVVAFHQRNATRTARWQGLAPAGFFSRELEHIGKTWLVFQQRHAVLVRVFAGCGGQLVHEALVGERIHVVAHGAPVAHAHAAVVNDQVVLRVGDAIRPHGGFGHERVHCVFGQTKGALGDRL